MLKDKQKEAEKQARAWESESRLVQYLSPLLRGLNERMDRRLVKTFLGMVMAVISHRHGKNGLLLSELGGYLLGAEACCAGTKRISKLLHSEKWAAEQVEDFQWGQASERVEALAQAGERALVIWDESVLEKPESLKAERLCAVRSSKANRLKRIKPGFFNPPGGRPICVPGFHWLKILVIGHKGPPTLAHMRWWTTRGEEQSTKRAEESAVFDQIDRLWGKEVIHIWDRGFAGNPWLTQIFMRGARFILRWPKDYQLLDEQEQLKKPGEISKGKRSWGHRLVWDARRRCERKTGIIAIPVFDRTHSQPLWLVVARRKGQPPWYLLTNQPAHSPDLAAWLLRTFCHRTGKRSRITPAPLYRLRFALSLLWLSPPSLFIPFMRFGVLHVFLWLLCSRRNTPHTT